MSNSTEYLNNKSFEEAIVKFQQAKCKTSQHRLLLEDLQSKYDRKLIKKKQEDPKVKGLIDHHKKQLFVAAADLNESKTMLATAFSLLSGNIVRYAKFEHIDPDDAVQEAVMVCFEKIDRFDTTRGKAFNYMTTVVFNHLRQLYRSARNYTDLKRRYQDFVHNALKIVI